MKKLNVWVLVGCMAMLMMACTSKVEKEMSGNPIFPGWYADPEGIVFDDEFWIYPTLSMLHGDDVEKYKAHAERKCKATYKDFIVQTHFDAFSSKDLVNWTKHSEVLSMENISWFDNALWAPSIIKANDKYYLFFGANNIQNNDQLGGIGVSVSDKPEGPFKDALVSLSLVKS